MAICPRSTRQDEHEPRKPIGDRHSGNQYRIVREFRRKERQSYETDPVAEIRHRGGSPQQPEPTRHGAHPARLYDALFPTSDNETAFRHY
jgi:hypothetical protein